MAADRELTVLAELGAGTGEAPVWDGGTQTLVVVDIPRGHIHRLDPGTGGWSTVKIGQPVGAAALRENGGLVAGCRDGFAVIDEASGTVRFIAQAEAPNAGNRMNDGKCDSRGRFWAGTTSTFSMPRAGGLYRLDGDHTVTQMLDGVSLSNGLGWSPDESTMYFIDSTTQRVDAYDFRSYAGTIHNRRTVVRVPTEDGMPDGMTVDDWGFLWIGLWNGGKVCRYDPDGVLERAIELPVSLVTCPTFGGPELDDLFITSARSKLSDHELRMQPAAGSVFRMKTHVNGVPAAKFAG